MKNQIIEKLGDYEKDICEAVGLNPDEVTHLETEDETIRWKNVNCKGSGKQQWKIIELTDEQMDCLVSLFHKYIPIGNINWEIL